MAIDHPPARRRPRPGSAPNRRSAAFRPGCQALEGRTLLSIGVPIPASNPRVPLSAIFWNGEPTPLNPNGLPNQPAPDRVGAAKTITITNSGSGTIYPFLRGGNYGEDPNSTSGSFYDPQDLTNHEFRQYIGFRAADGTANFGLPKGASITFQVPLVLWDGNNLYIATDGANLTAATPNIYNYDPTAQVCIAGAEPVSNSVWVQGSAGYPAGETPLVLFYFAGGLPKTVPDDAPAQLTEITFRDPYLTRFITDPAQTFPLINYDVSYVNNLVAPVAMEASRVPITYGDSKSTTTPPEYFGFDDFGWLATDRNPQAFQAAINAFVQNTGAASLGAYFGPNRPGWPQYYSPTAGNTVIPSGSNLFDDSPLTVNGGIVHPSSYDSNRWMLTSNGTGPIAARAGGVILTDPQATVLPLSMTTAERVEFSRTMTSMLARGGQVNLTVSPSTQVLGRVLKYDPTDSIQGIAVTRGGSGYSAANPPQVVLSGGGGTGAQAIAFVGADGSITGVGTVKPGSGYTSPPTIRFVGGGGTGAAAAATIGGGRVTVALNPGATLPINAPLSYVFSRPSNDYAITAITNLWYSWAQYYVQQYQNVADQAVAVTLVRRAIPGSKDLTPQVTNEVTLAADPKVPLVVGMTVRGTGIPAGTTILKVDGRQLLLSQIPTTAAPTSQSLTFGRPQALPYDPAVTKPFALKFAPTEASKARLFAGSVYEAMAAQAVALPASPYLPTSMNLVAHVIKFWAELPGYNRPWGPILVGEVRDIVKSILRGVYDFEAVPDQSQWYPAPSKPTGGQPFNVYNLDPYVWFVHVVQGMSAYGFSVDDDVSNPTATGPILAAGGAGNHAPNNLQIAYGGVGKLGNTQQWFPTTPWGALRSNSTRAVTATIGVVPSGEFAGYSMITFTGPNALKLYNQINNPGSGQVGAYVTAPGFIVPGTTLIHKGPISGTIPSIVLSQKAIPTTTPIPIVVTAAPIAIPKTPLANGNFWLPVQGPPNRYTVAPTGPDVGWAFAKTAGIAASGSLYTRNNPDAGGDQVAFLTRDGGISQMVDLDPGRVYAVSFLVAQRVLDDGTVNAQTLQVRLGGKVIGNFTAKAVDGRYVRFTSDPFRVPDSTDRNLVIVGTNLNGNHTALIDQVQITG